MQRILSHVTEPTGVARKPAQHTGLSARSSTPFGTVQLTARDVRSTVLQRSKLSTAVERVWLGNLGKGQATLKGSVFELLRREAPAPDDTELAAILARIFSGGSEDLWLAERLQKFGAEPLWPSVDKDTKEHVLSKRQALAQKYGEAGPAQGSLTTSAEGKPITAYYFPGLTDNRALVLGGVHGSELSGIQVVETLVGALRTGPRPYYTVVIVPRLFPDNAAVAESKPKQIGTAANVGRKTKGRADEPSRQFPALGKAFDPDSPNPTDAKGDPIERENVALLKLIDRFRPDRIASIHATHDPKSVGIFADPKTDEKGKALGPDEDKKLALAMAGRAREGSARVPANRLGSRRPSARYPGDPLIVAKGKHQKRDTKKGISLGGWGTTAVVDSEHRERSRAAMTVVTVEVAGAERTGDVALKDRKARGLEIQAHVDALREIFLGPPEAVEAKRTPGNEALGGAAR